MSRLDVYGERLQLGSLDSPFHASSLSNYAHLLAERREVDGGVYAAFESADYDEVLSLYVPPRLDG